MTGKLFSLLTLFPVYCFLFTNLLCAQNISISASVDKNTVALDDHVVLQVIVSGNVSNIPSPTMPTINGFTVSSAGSSQNYSFVNGQASSSKVFNYVLTPQSVGKYTIDSVTLTHQNQTYKTNPITIEVVQSAGGGQPSVTAQGSKATVPSGTSRGKEMFITTSIDKKTVYVNEPITLSFRFYYRARLLAQPQYKPASTSGFWSEDLPPQQQYQTTTDGKQYMVTEIKTALFPTSAGKYTIGSANLRCAVEDFSPDNFSNDDFFRGFFSQSKTIDLKSDPIEITVLPLPAGKPADFNGAVGNYKITASVDKTQIPMNQAITLKITVSGKGNIKTISEPSLTGLTNFKKYQTVSSVNISKQDYQVSGSKVFTIVIVPQTIGKQIISPIKYSYFNPETKSYYTVQTEPININVTPGNGGPAFTSYAIPNEVKMLGSDIRYIKTNPTFKIQANTYINAILLILYFMGIMLPMASWFYRNRENKFSSDIKLARYSRAGKLARKKLKTLEKQPVPDVVQFCTQLFNIVTEYLANKFNISSAGLTVYEIEQQLAQKNVVPETINQIKQIWEQCDLARFAPSKIGLENRQQNIENTLKLIETLEKTL